MCGFMRLPSLLHRSQPEPRSRLRRKPFAFLMLHFAITFVFPQSPLPPPSIQISLRRESDIDESHRPAKAAATLSDVHLRNANM